MNQDNEIGSLLRRIKQGALSVEEGEKILKNLPYEDFGYAKLDYHRKLRTGFPETVYCQGKEDEHLVKVFVSLYSHNGEVMGTRAEPRQYELVRQAIPAAVYDPVSRIIRVREGERRLEGCIAVCTGGTADISVAEEAAQTAEFFGCYVERIYDVGVSGIHRLLGQREKLDRANCIVAVAGMEGALGTVIAGLVKNPVIAVPTSVGYGANFGGLSALLTMINSCANGISVVNIDNGYGAGYLSTQINRLAVNS